MSDTFPYITDPVLQDYCVQHSTQPNTFFKEVRESSEATGRIKLISDHFLGQYLRMMSKVLAPKNILEIGTFTGYGTLSLLEGIQPDGIVYTIEKSEDWLTYSKRNFAQSSKKHQIKQLIGDAAELITTIDLTWDLVFIDAAKRQYINYLDLVLPKVRKGGIILADNVLWKGKVGHPNNDKLGQGLDAFNKYVFQHESLENIILPIDDGLNFILKRD